MSESRVCSQCGQQNSAERVNCQVCQSPLILSGSRDQSVADPDLRVRCPFCAEEILAAAKKCEHCGEWLNGEMDPVATPVTTPNQKPLPRSEPTKSNTVSAEDVQEPMGTLGAYLVYFMLFMALVAWGVTSCDEPGTRTDMVGPDTASVAATDSAPPAGPSVSTLRSGVVETTRGTFTIPGQAWTDGRDLEATPPLTVESINVWDAALRSTVVCRVQHGQQVETLAAERNNAEGRWYLKIRRGSCEGWLPEDWLNKQRHPAVGDRV